MRHDYARAVAETCWILIINKDQYDQIVKRTQLSVSEQKIDFLMRYVPKLRAVTRTMIEELEILFIKEIVTQGFMIQKQEDQGDYLYFVFKGRCRLLLTAHNAEMIPASIAS